MTNNKRVGRFSVSNRLLRDCKDFEGAGLFAGMIVLRAEPRFDSDTTEFFAAHPDFKEVSACTITPEYRAIFDSGSTVPRWEEVRSGGTG